MVLVGDHYNPTITYNVRNYSTYLIPKKEATTIGFFTSKSMNELPDRILAIFSRAVKKIL